MAAPAATADDAPAPAAAEAAPTSLARTLPEADMPPAAARDGLQPMPHGQSGWEVKVHTTALPYHDVI